MNEVKTYRFHARVPMENIRRSQLEREEILDRTIRASVKKVAEQMAIEDLKKIFSIEVYEHTPEKLKRAINDENFELCEVLTMLKENDEIVVMGSVTPSEH